MNDIMQVNNISKTMSSREMAALCKKRHDNTLLIIRDLENRGLLENSRPYTTRTRRTASNILNTYQTKETVLSLLRAYLLNLWQQLLTAGKN